MKRHTWAKRHCTWNGVFYPSITAAARALGISVHTMRYRLAKKWTCDADVERGGRSKPVYWNGVKYPSCDAAAKAHYISRAGMWYRVVKRGYKGDKDMRW